MLVLFPQLVSCQYIKIFILIPLYGLPPQDAQDAHLASVVPTSEPGLWSCDSASTRTNRLQAKLRKEAINATFYRADQPITRQIKQPLCEI